MRNQEIKNAINHLESDGVYIPAYIDLGYISENEDIQSVDDLIDRVEQYIQETEITYYSTAMKFLTDNDTSRTNSLDLAHEMGCSLEYLNSEPLATILLQDLLRSELYAIL